MTSRLPSRSGLSRSWDREWNEFRELSEVLGAGELIMRTAWPSKYQAIQLENALEMSEQHFDLLSKPA
jgi:hypothetical protein